MHLGRENLNIENIAQEPGGSLSSVDASVTVSKTGIEACLYPDPRYELIWFSFGDAGEST